MTREQVRTSGREALILGAVLLACGVAVLVLGGVAKGIAAQVRRAESGVSERLLAAAGMPR